MRRLAGHLDRAMNAEAVTWTRDAPRVAGFYWYRMTFRVRYGTGVVGLLLAEGDTRDFDRTYVHEIYELLANEGRAGGRLLCYRHGRSEDEEKFPEDVTGGEWWPYPLSAPPANPSADLPEVAGPLAVTLAQLERRARTLLGEEQRKPNPDNAVIAVLCDTVRCVREYNATVGRLLTVHDDLVATDRRRYLAVQAVRYLRRNAEDTIHYDGAECDGACLADDISAAFDFTPEDLEKKP